MTKLSRDHQKMSTREKRRYRVLILIGGATTSREVST
jgi:hypothetical protein